jgi:hypothetical protein
MVRISRSASFLLVITAAAAVAACNAGGSLHEPSARASAGGFGKPVNAGPGLVDASVRQVVRTPGQRVWIFAADDTAFLQDIGPGVIRAWRATTTGIPFDFKEADGKHRPRSSFGHVLTSPDVRLDGKGIARMIYVNAANAKLVYRTFSTKTGRWGAAATVAGNATTPDESGIPRGQTACTLVLDRHGRPQVVFMQGANVRYVHLTGSGWTKPVTIATGAAPIHPQLAADSSGGLSLAWLDQGTPSIMYARKPPGGSWGSPEVVDDTEVRANDTLDQGPSVVVAGGIPSVLYIDNNDFVQVQRRIMGTWEDWSPSSLYAHTPQIYQRGKGLYAFLGHDIDIHYGYARRLAGQSTWTYSALTGNKFGTPDGSASVRWDPLHETNSHVIDTTFFDENFSGDFDPRLYYMAVKPS